MLIITLWDIIQSTKSVFEKRLRIDLAAIKEMMKKKKISAVCWVGNNHQLSDCLTERGACSNKLLEVINTGHLLL